MQLLLIELPVVPVVAHAPNHGIVLPALGGCILALGVAFVCNQRGALLPAGVLMVASIEITVGVKIWTTPGGISVFYLPRFDILVQPILIAVALLAPWSAFAVALLNAGFFLTAMLVGPHAPDLVAALHNPIQVGDLFSVPIMTQVLTAFFGWIIVKNLLEALKRASQAEQIAALEHAIAQSQAAFQARNQELEWGVATIVQVIQAVANRATAQRIALPSRHVLWPVAQQLNHFLDRYHRARSAEATLDATMCACTELANALHQATLDHRPLQYPPLRHTPLDAVLFLLSREQTPQPPPAPQVSRAYPSGKLTHPTDPWSGDEQPFIN